MPAVYLKGIHRIGVDFLEAWWVTCAWVTQVPLATVDKMETHLAGLVVECPLAASVGKPKVVERFGPHRHCTPFLQWLEAQDLPLCCDLWRGENRSPLWLGILPSSRLCLRWTGDSSTHSFGRAEFSG